MRATRSARAAKSSSMYRIGLTPAHETVICASHAGIAQLVEHDLAKVGVASSSLVSRSRLQTKPRFAGVLFIRRVDDPPGRRRAQRHGSRAATIVTGLVAEWSCSGLQSRVRRFDSDPGLHVSRDASRCRVRDRQPPRGGGRSGRCIHASHAGIAQLVEHDLAKVGVASSSLVSRSSLHTKPRFAGAFVFLHRAHAPRARTLAMASTKTSSACAAPMRPPLMPPASSREPCAAQLAPDRDGVDWRGASGSGSPAARWSIRGRIVTMGGDVPPGWRNW